MNVVNCLSDHCNLLLNNCELAQQSITKLITAGDFVVKVQ